MGSGGSNVPFTDGRGDIGGIKNDTTTDGITTDPLIPT
jgi:hypothetical protein